MTERPVVEAPPHPVPLEYEEELVSTSHAKYGLDERLHNTNGRSLSC